jgi:hypothetical protein
MNDNVIPFLVAEVGNKAGMLKVWCKYCKEWHLHGKLEGYWTAHCTNPNSPYLKSGYLLRCPDRTFKEDK